MTTDSKDSTVYQAAFFIVPSRIMYLPEVTLAFIKVYETIFQFWNHNQKCFLSDKKIMERTGLSERTVRDAFIFFENYKELKREKKGARRYLVQPTLYVETNPVDNLPEKCTNTVTTGIPLPVDRHSSAGVTGTPLPHNKNKLNNKNLNKSSCHSDEQKKANKQKHDWSDRPGEMKQAAKFWGPGHEDYDRLNPTTKDSA